MKSPDVRFYGYFVVDTRVEPPKPIAFGLSRKDGREIILKKSEDEAKHLRVRRAKITLFPS